MVQQLSNFKFHSTNRCTFTFIIFNLFRSETNHFSENLSVPYPILNVSYLDLCSSWIVSQYAQALIIGLFPLFLSEFIYFYGPVDRFMEIGHMMEETKRKEKKRKERTDGNKERRKKKKRMIQIYAQYVLTSRLQLATSQQP